MINIGGSEENEKCDFGNTNLVYGFTGGELPLNR
jgi:hypothetical protein